MASLNQATIIGFLGDNPKINTTQSGRKMASFSVATTERGIKREMARSYRTKPNGITLSFGEVSQR